MRGGRHAGTRRSSDGSTRVPSSFKLGVALRRPFEPPSCAEGDPVPGRRAGHAALVLRDFEIEAEGEPDGALLGKLPSRFRLAA